MVRDTVEKRLRAVSLYVENSRARTYLLAAHCHGPMLTCFAFHFKDILTPSSLGETQKKLQ